MYDPLIYWEARAPHWLANEIKPTDEWWPLIEPYVKPEWNVLELGCGDGRWSQHFPNYTGADISSTLVVAAKEKYPDKNWAHHDMRQSISGNWDLIFTFTSWLHVPPTDIAKVTLPDTNYLFIEPHGESRVEHCFQHDFPALFGVKKLHTKEQLTMYGRFL